MQKIFAGLGAPIRRNEDIHFPEPLIRYGSLWGGSRVGAASFCRRDRAHAGVSQPSGLKAISPNKSSPAKILPLGEGLQMHYVEAQYRPLKGCIGERFHGRSNGSNGQHGVTGKGQIRARTSPQPT